MGTTEDIHEEQLEGGQIVDDSPLRVEVSDDNFQDLGSDNVSLVPSQLREEDEATLLDYNDDLLLGRPDDSALSVSSDSTVQDGHITRQFQTWTLKWTRQTWVMTRCGPSRRRYSEKTESDMNICANDYSDRRKLLQKNYRLNRKEWRWP